MAFGLVNPLAALATVVTRLEVFLEVDLRSADAGELAKLDSELHAIVESAVAQENAARDTSKGKVSAVVKILGERPAGHTDEKSPLAAGAAAAARVFGYEPKFIAVSTDANIPMSLGIPAIAIGSGASGGREHAPDEYIDVAKAESVRGMTVGLATIVFAAGGISE